MDITLDQAPGVTFKVRLPSNYNREYARVLYAGGRFELDDDGQLVSKTSVIEAAHANQDAFLKGCLLSMNGGPIPEKFAEEYPEALAELMVKAREMADALDEGIGEQVKKSATSSSGQTLGEESTSSTANSVKAAG